MGTLIRPLLTALAWAYYSSPRFLRRATASALGAFLASAGFRRKVIRQNLEYAFPKDLARREKLERAAYDHLARLSLEILLLFGPMKKFALGESELQGLE